MSANFSQSALASAVRAEAGNWQAVGSLYGQAASELSELFTSKGNGAVHSYMCAAQDLTGDPMVWNRSLTGLKKALSALPTALVFVAVRDFRPTHRNRAPLFEMATKASVASEKAEAARIANEKAKSIEADAAAQAAQAQLDAEAKITVDDVAKSVMETCDRLHLNKREIAVALIKALESDTAAWAISEAIGNVAPAAVKAAMNNECDLVAKPIKATVAKAA